jgi:hypothetical protein
MAILDKNKAFCIYKDVKYKDILKYSYVVSGEEHVEESVEVTLDGKLSTGGSRTNVIYNNRIGDSKDKSVEAKYLKNDDAEYSLERDTEISLCFKCAKYSDVIVSFEIFTMNESGHILSLAKDGNFICLIFLFKITSKNISFKN